MRQISVYFKKKVRLETARITRCTWINFLVNYCNNLQQKREQQFNEICQINRSIVELQSELFCCNIIWNRVLATLGVDCISRATETIKE